MFLATSTVREALLAFLSANARAYNRLAEQAFEDGVRQYAEEFGRQVQVARTQHDAVMRRLFAFHQPSLLRIHHELTALTLTANHSDAVGRWFQANAYRVEGAIGGILWAASEAGYAYAATADGQQLYWNLEDAAQHCTLCPIVANGGPYTAVTLPCFPADGVTPCGGHCRCWMTVGAPDPHAE